MTINVNANSYDSSVYSLYNNANNKGIKYNSGLLNKTEADSFTPSSTINEDTMTEAMTIKKESFWGKETTLHGMINNNVSKLQVSRESAFGETNVTGNVGDKEVAISYKNNLSGTKTNYKGQIGDNSFELKIETKGFLGNKSTITGTINGKPVCFELKGGKIPEDKDTQDILTTILMLDGSEAKQKDGHFNGIQMSDIAEQEAEIEAAETAMCWALM